MKAELGWLALVLVGLVGCGGTSSSGGNLNTDPETLRNSPAGIATLVFMDLVTAVPPTALPVPVSLPPAGGAIGLALPASLPSCIQASTVGLVTTFKHNNCIGANSGVLNGTVAVTLGSGTSTTKSTFTEVFNLTSTLTATQSWAYTGTQTLSVTWATATAPATAVLSTSPASTMQAVYTDQLNPSNNKTYVFTPAFTLTWDATGRLQLDGGYTFARAGVETVGVSTVANNALVWGNGCGYPSSGTLNLTYTSTSLGNTSTTASFGPTCGQMSLGGGALSLGSN